MSMKKTDYVGVYQDDVTNKIQIQVSLGTDPVTGKRVRVKTMMDESNKPFRTVAEAHRFVTILKAKYYRTGSYSVSNTSFTDFVDDEYIVHYKSLVKPQTFDTKKNIIYILQKKLGKTNLNSIGIKEVHKLRQWIVNQGYKQSYSSSIFSTFKRIMDYAVILNYIQSNPALKVPALPKGRADVKFWTREEFEAVLSVISKKNISEHLCYVMLILYFMSSARVNECTALYWENVDFNKKQIYIGHNLIMKNKKDFIRSTELKTKNATRYVSLDDSTMNVLKEWHKVQCSIGLGNKKDFVLSVDDLPMGKSTISRIISRYANKAGVHDIEAKGLRHSSVSYMINELNADILTISRRLGHSSPEITYRHYSHLYSGADRDIAEAMNGSINLGSACDNQ